MTRLFLAASAAFLVAACSGSRLAPSQASLSDSASGIVATVATVPPPGPALAYGSDSDEFPPCPPAPPLPTSDAAALETAPAVGASAPDETAPIEAEDAGTEPSAAEVMDTVAPPAAPSNADVSLQMCCGCKECDSCCAPCWGNRRCGGYVGASLAAWPGLGVALHGGVNFAMSERVLWSYDASLLYQDMTDDFVGDKEGEFQRGKFSHFRLGVRGRFNPCCSRWHPTVRAGIGWANITGQPNLADTLEMDDTGDYFGGYIGVGLEFDINHRWSTGPEAAIFGGWNVDTEEFGWAPTLYWHFTYKF